MNGGFETGNFNGWTVNDPSPFAPPSLTYVGSNPAFAHSGTHQAYLGSDPGIVATLTQAVTTTSGSTYDLSFWLASDMTIAVNNALDVFWNGAVIMSVTNLAPTGGGNIGQYLNYTFTNLPAASGASTDLQFRFRNDDDYFRLDDVSVTAAVPEPSTVSFAIFGIALLGAGMYRRARS